MAKKASKKKAKAKKGRRRITLRVPLRDPHVYPADNMIIQIQDMDDDQFDSAWVACVMDTIMFDETCQIKDICRMLSAVREIYRERR